MRGILISGLIALLLAGCVSQRNSELIPFTQDLRTRYQLTDDELTRLQYYISDDLDLRRQQADSGREVVGGRLVARSEQNLAQVLVHRYTPGIATGVRGNQVDVSFSEGTAFTFVPERGDARAPYRLQAVNNPRQETRQVMIYDIPYRVTAQDSLPYLLIDRETLFRTREQTYQLPGRKLNSN